MPRFAPLAGALAFLFGSGCAGTSQTQVRVENTGAVTLDSVWLFADGDSVLLGSLTPGQQITVRLRPTGESHLEISHASAPEHLVADTYFEPGYRGPIRVLLQADRTEVSQHARP